MKQFSEVLKEQYSLEKPVRKFVIKNGTKNTIQAKLGEVDSGWKVTLDSSDENGIQVSNNNFRHNIVTVIEN